MAGFMGGKMWQVCVGSCLVFVLLQRKILVTTLEVAFSKVFEKHPFKIYITVTNLTYIHMEICCCILVPFSYALFL